MKLDYIGIGLAVVFVVLLFLNFHHPHIAKKVLKPVVAVSKVVTPAPVAVIKPVVVAKPVVTPAPVIVPKPVVATPAPVTKPAGCLNHGIYPRGINNCK